MEIVAAEPEIHAALDEADKTKCLSIALLHPAHIFSGKPVE
jgi:hypothetical protein